MAVGTDVWELILDLKARFDSLGTPSQFIWLSMGSLFCSFIYGYLLDGWINDEVADNDKVIAQSENLFAMLAAITHASCAAFERILRDAFAYTRSKEHNTSQSVITIDRSDHNDHSNDEELGLLSNQPTQINTSNEGWNVIQSIFYRDASLRAYMLYSTL
eukprot:406673_1